MVVAYFEPIFGASGDMILSAFVDAGLPLPVLKESLQNIIPEQFDLKGVKVNEKGVTATRLNVQIEKVVKFRGLSDIKKLFFETDLKKEIAERAFNTIRKIAEVEAKIHGINIEDVHFHELGAIDTIIDVVGFFVALDFFKIEKVYVGRIPFGKGFVNTEHGVMPVPAFATLELLKNFPVYGIDIDFENITPTAAAIFSKNADFSLFPEMLLKQIGYGAGSKTFEGFRNLLRLSIGEKEEYIKGDVVLVIEFSIDDMSPELLGVLIEKLIKAGAKDCYFTSLIGKKGRPATLVTVLTAVDEKDKICDIIFSETTTLGVRYRLEARTVLKREVEVMQTSLGNVRVKKAFYKDVATIKPEFEDMNRLAVEKGIPLKQVYSIILGELKQK